MRPVGAPGDAVLPGAGLRRTAPRLAGRTELDALRELQTLGLAACVRYRDEPQRHRVGLVVAQSPDGFDPVADDAVVVIWVGAGPIPSG